MNKLILAGMLALLLWAAPNASHASEADLYCQTGSGPNFQPVNSTNPCPISTAIPITAKACSSTTIGTGGTAITIVAGPVNGGFITNPLNAAAQNIVTAENANIDMVATPSAGDAGGSGTAQLLVPGQPFTVPPLSSSGAIKINASTTGHKFTCEVW